MSKTTRTLLGISVASLAFGLAFATGLINANNTVDLYVALPLGAVLFGLFLISRLLEKEVSLYDNEQARHDAQGTYVVTGTQQETRSRGHSASPIHTSSAAH